MNGKVKLPRNTIPRLAADIDTGAHPDSASHWLASARHDDTTMTNKEFVTIGNRILASLPGYTAQKNLVFANPIGHTLKGVCFDRSAFDARSFYVQVFIQPMFVPAKHLGFNLGWRVGGGSHRWNADDPNMISDLTDALEREGVPFLSRVRSPREVVAAAASLNKTKDPYVQEAIAYALALAGDSEQAVAAFDHLAALLDVQIP